MKHKNSGGPISLKPKGKIRVAFVSTSVAPYSISTRIVIDQDPNINARHFFARKIEPGRQWHIEKLPKSFEIVKGTVLNLRSRFFYFPIGLPQSLKKYNPDFIISEQLGILLIMTYVYSIIAAVPVLLRWEGTPHTEQKYHRPIRKLFRRWLIKFASGFFCYSPDAINYLKSLGAAGPFYTIPYSVDQSFYKASELPRNNKAFLFVGNLSERKGIRYLLKAFSQIVNREPDAELWIAGDGPLRNEIEQILHRRPQNNVHLLGYCNKEKVKVLFQTAGIFVCPTLSDHGPMVQIEAAISGLPIISTPFSGNAKLVINPGENGEIVDPRDSDKLVSVMLKILRFPDKQSMETKSIELGKVHSPSNEAETTISNLLNYKMKRESLGFE